MIISRIHHCSFIVQDLERALDFYCRILGLSLDKRRPDLGYPGAWLMIGDQQIHLMQLADPYASCVPPVHGGRDRHIALMVDNIQQLENVLEQNRIAYTRSKSGRPALFCRDPDQNTLEFVQQA